MQITFDTTTITDDEVRGIFALLDTVRPAAFDPGPFDAEAVTRKVEEKLADKGWVAGPSDTVATLRIEPVEETVSTFDGEEFPQSPVPPTTDSTGLPWDERIHASSKALNADGTWRTKRGVDKALVASVEAELRQSAAPDVRYFYHPESETFYTAADDSSLSEGHAVELSKEEWEDRQKVSAPVSPPPAPPAPEAPPAPLAPAVTESALVETAPQTQSAPPAPSSAVSPFVALMKRVTTAQGAGKLTQPRVKELLESLDKKSIMDLRTDDDALASFAVLLDGEGV